MYSNYSSVEMIEKVQVYLLDGDKEICFWNGPVSDFTQSAATNKWIILQADKSIGDIENDYDAGMI